MRIVSFIEPSQPDVIEKILRHCRLWEQPSPAPPAELPGPPQDYGLREPRYVNDLQFVHDFVRELPDWPAA